MRATTAETSASKNYSSTVPVAGYRIYRRQPGPFNRRKRIKHAVKWLADGQDPTIVRSYISKSAPDEVIKAISNAALNLKHGPVQLPPKRKALFRRYNKAIEKLIDAGQPIAAKRRLILQRKQKGGFLPILPILAPILSSALGALGAEFIPRLFNRKP